MIVCRRLKETFSYYVYNMSQANTHPFEDFAIRENSKGIEVL